MRELLDTIELLAQGDDFSKHTSLVIVFLSLKDKELGLSAIRQERRLLFFIQKMGAYICQAEKSGWVKRLEDAHYPFTNRF